MRSSRLNGLMNDWVSEAVSRWVNRPPEVYVCGLIYSQCAGVYYSALSREVKRRANSTRHLCQHWERTGSRCQKWLQILILALMRAVAGRTLAIAALALIVLLIPFRAAVVWAFWAVPVGGMILSAGSLDATRLVAANTPGKPPFKPVLVGVSLTIIGIALSLASGAM